MSVTDSAVTESSTDPPQLIIPSDPPRRSSRAKEFSSGLLFNLIIPVALILAGFVAMKLLGVATAPPRGGDDTTREGRLKALAAVRVEKIRSLESTGEQLQLIVDGTVVPYREAFVAAEVGGRIIEKSDNCEAGSVVQKGDVLMKIDPTDYEIEVDRLTRLKEQEYQALQEIDQEKLNTSRLIDVAEQDVKLQQAEVDRQQSLPKGFASRGEIDQAKRSLIQAQQTLVTSQNTLALLEKRRVRLEASEKLAVTQLKAAELNLQRTEIVAPIDGVIIAENADVNSFVNRGTVLLTIEDTSRVEVATSLRMDQLYWVLDQQRDENKAGNAGYDLPDTEAIIQYDLTGREDESYSWKGRLLSYDGVGLDPQTRTVPVRVLVEEPTSFVNEAGTQNSSTAPNALLRGMYVQVKLQIKPKTPLVVIPGKALQPGNHVWQFVPDESVLDAPPAKEEDANSDESGDNADDKAKIESIAAADAGDVSDDKDGDETSKQPESSFKPENWTPGRVVVQRSVYPVDALTYQSGRSGEKDAPFESNLAGDRQFWVCETKGKEFEDDAFVVTSPLSGVDGGGLAARAELGMDADAKLPADESVQKQTAQDKTANAKSARQTPAANSDQKTTSSVGDAS